MKDHWKKLFPVVAFCSAVAYAGDSTDALDRLKALVGDWHGTNQKGDAVKTAYRLTAGGSTLVETLNAGTNHEMLTVFYRDANRAMATHFCAAGNQPRFTVTQDGSKVILAFLDGTNLERAKDGHIDRVTIQLADKDHLVERWTWKDASHESTDVFTFERVR
jgi:hypothetical protein